MLLNIVPKLLTTSLFLLAVYLKKPKGNLYERTVQCIATKHTDTVCIHVPSERSVGKTRGVGEVAPDLVHIVCVN